MIDYLVDDNFDVVLPLQKVTDPNDLLFQQVRLLLHTWQEDFPYDVTMGIPYEQKILGISKVDVTDIETIYYNKISKLVHFKTIENFKIERNANRELLITFDVVSLDNVSQTFEQVA